MNVPFIDFSEQYQTIKEEVDLGLKETFERGDFIMGKAAREFEAEFAQFCSVRYAAGVNSGTDALYLALSAYDIVPGDEVILPAFTFIATALCISYTGAKPVFVDVEEKTFNIDPEKFKSAITNKTKAVMPVHLYGQPANMKEICNIAKEYNIKVIEDAAQAHGSSYENTRVGALGDVACFSFYPTKGLGGFGDGGMAVTNDKDVYEKIQMLRDYGRKDRYEHKIKGYNSRLDSVQAVVLSAKLKHLDKWNKMRKAHGAYYAEILKGVDGVILPNKEQNRDHVYQTYAVRVKNRDKVCELMKEKGIAVLIHYPIPIPHQEAYKELGAKKGDFPISEQLADEVLSLPMFPHMNKAQIEAVCEGLKKSIKETKELQKTT